MRVELCFVLQAEDGIRGAHYGLEFRRVLFRSEVGVVEAAALDGSLNDAEFRKDPNFGFEFPVAVPGVDSAILDPRNAWADKAAYDRKLGSASGRERVCHYV